MNRLLPFALMAVAMPALVAKAAPVFAENFESAKASETPKDLLVIAGSFTVQEVGTNKVLELPGAPLDSFGALFGPSEADGVNASGRFFGTKSGRKMPAFGLSLHGAGGYRLQVSAAKKALEIFKGDESRASVPFEWPSGVWTSLRIQSRKTPAGTWIIEGRAWPSDGAEPTAWQISLEEKTAPAAGRAGIWGSPYSGTPIRFDDLTLSKNAP
jgi:hypothetical protein